MMRRGEDDEDSVFVVADKVFRLQVKWMIQHAGVCKEFPVVMRKIWWSYLTAAMPDVADGVEQVLLSEPEWMYKLRDVDLAQLFDIPQRHLKAWLLSLEETAFPGENLAESRKAGNWKTTLTRWPVSSDGKRLGGSQRWTADRLRHQRLLAMINLGLLLCGEHTLMSDLLRWSRTLQFPYLNIQLTPEEYAAYNKINENFSIPVPVYAEVEWLTAMMARNLKLKHTDFPPVYAAPVVARFVEELNLPRPMIGFVMGFVEAVHSTELLVQVEPGSFRGGRTRSQGVESIAMACVVYAMRIMLGMDGESEIRISTATAALQELVGETVPLFNFREWVGHMDYRRLQLYRHTHLLPWACVRTQLFLLDTGPFQPNLPGNVSGSISEEQKRCLTRRLEEESVKSSYPLVFLPPTHRPFRAHTEALAKTYPRLAADFSSHSIQHLLNDQCMPKSWKIPSSHREQAKVLWAELRGAQIAGKDTCPYRAQNWIGVPAGYVPLASFMDEVPSFSMRWFLEVCAEIIEQSPERLLKEVLFVELALFPHNEASKLAGRGYVCIAKMRTG